MCQSCDSVRPDEAPEAPLLTRRRVLVAGAVAGATVAFTGLPALGQTGSASSGDGDDAGATSTTDSTTTTTTAPPRDLTATPVHGEEPVVGSLQGYDTLLSEKPDRKIMWPLLGRPNNSSTWTDTYGAPRGGGTRRHQGQDLLAPQMTKILSVCDGTIVEFRHRSSGNSVWIRGDDGWFYCYLHINDERPGTHITDNKAEYAWAPQLRQYVGNETAARGHRVRKGEFIAYLGDSGNAEPTYHLHFEIRKPATGTFSSETQRMWSSASVNAVVSLQNAAPAVERGPVDPAVFTPWDNSTDFLNYQYRDFLGRAPSAGDLSYYGEILNYGTKSPDWAMQLFLESEECDGKTHSVARLYQAFYKRLPDSAGFAYWLDMRRNRGWSINRMAEQFSKAPEFTRLYGSLTNAQYVDLVYRNVLNRDPEAAGKEYWVGELESGRINRGRMMTQVSESPENKRSRKNEMHVIACYGVMLDRMPTASEQATWKGILDGGNSTRDMIVMLRMSDEYAAAIANS